jgi:hypothetical protein
LEDLEVDDIILLALKKYDVLLWAKVTLRSVDSSDEIFWSHK